MVFVFPVCKQAGETDSHRLDCKAEELGSTHHAQLANYYIIRRSSVEYT